MAELPPLAIETVLSVDELESGRVLVGPVAVLDRPASVLRERLPGVLRRVCAIEASGGNARVQARIGELVRQTGRGDPAVERTVYQLDAFRLALAGLREELELRTDGREDIDRELEHDDRRPLRVARDFGPSKRTARVLSRRGMLPEVSSIDRDSILRVIAETAFLEAALPRLEEPAEHRVFLELLRVGQGRRPPAYERATEGFFEWLVRFYASLRGEVIGAAARGVSGRVTRQSEPVDLDALLVDRPLHVVLEVIGLGARSFFASEEGCHAWTSLLSGSEIVRVRVIEPAEDATPARAIDDHLRDVRAFDAALARTEWPLPVDPGGLLPAVRRVRFDPPARPGETSLLEIEDLVTSEVRAHHAARVADGLRPLVWLRASRRSP